MNLALRLSILGLLLYLVAVPCLAQPTAPVKEPAPANEPAPTKPRPRVGLADQLPLGVTAKRDLEYARVGDRALLLDLYLPENKNAAPLPLIIWIHGGGWQNGSKFPARQALPFTAYGYAVASVEYRLTDAGPFPMQIEDCKAAIRWLRANADKYQLDPKHFAAFGASAGGHLAALVGTSGNAKELSGKVGEHLDQSSAVQAVCDFYGPTDLVQMASTAGYQGHARADSPESKLIGGAVLDNKAAAERANPIHYIGKETPPFLIIHGDMDPLVPPGQSQLLHDALTKAGIESEIQILAGAKHGGPEFATPEQQKKMLAFFDKHLKASSKESVAK